MQSVFVSGSAADLQWNAAILRNRRIAARIFGGLFTFACVGQTILFGSIVKHQEGKLLLFALPSVIGLMAALEWWNGRDSRGPVESHAGSVSPRVVLPIWLIAGLESLAPVAAIWLLSNVVGWDVALGGPPMIAAVVFPFVSILRLDYRICLLQGIIGAVLVTGMALLVSYIGPKGHPFTSTDWVWTLGKGAVLVGTGAVAGIIAHQSRCRLQEVIQEQVKREAVQVSLRTRTADYHRVADALVGKNELISILSHDLRAPLDGVASLAELMARAPDQFTADDVRRYAAEIQTTTHDLRELLDNLVVWAELKAGREMPTLQPLSLHELVTSVTRLFEPALTAQRLALEVSIPLNVLVWGEPAAIATVVRNLVSNAVKYTPQGGRITLDLETAEQSDRVGLVVTDTGPRLSADSVSVADDLSATEETTQSVGGRSTPRGLGLALCRQLLIQLNGSLELSSGPEGGTEARVWLQRPPEDQADSQTGA